MKVLCFKKKSMIKNGKLTYKTYNFRAPLKSYYINDMDQNTPEQEAQMRQLPQEVNSGDESNDSPICSKCFTHNASCILWNFGSGTTGWACNSCRHDR